ncbi:hypothetical protein NC652_036625 [Populus alba x Populus x berolinensis]|nr:hypothetical protein NC652_036625 [Populus alba x Populus x berolinensis]
MELIVAYARVKKGAAIKLAGGIRMILASTADSDLEIDPRRVEFNIISKYYFLGLAVTAEGGSKLGTVIDIDPGTIYSMIDVPRIINEPTAATIAYGLDKKGGDNGGGTS